jgi:phosphoenolpyruvate carboxykinase (diphosphate)
MDFIASLTGKSPSTTGAGSEGAMTKAPFNNLPPIVDLNNALVAYLCTKDGCFTSAAGVIGPKYRVDHDISLLVPEFWSRMRVFDRDPAYLIANGFLEPCEDFEYEGRQVLGSRLGYRITDRFQRHFLGRVLSNPAAVFTEDMLRPELQDMALYVESIETLVATQQRVAKQYFEDGSIEYACPPLKALLHIMVEGSYEGKDVNHPEIRELFTHDSMVGSEWYTARLQAQQERDIARAEQTIRNLEGYLHSDHVGPDSDPLGVRDRLAEAREELARRQKPDYLQSLQGTIGLDPLLV